MFSDRPRKGADPRLTASRHRFNFFRVLLAGACTAALFGSRVLLQDIDSAPDMRFYAHIRAAAALWQRAMTHTGFTKPDQALHEAVKGAENWHSPGAPP